MKSDSKRLLLALRKEKTAHPPFWFMRQAGRYLPEYRQLRSQTGDFLTLCYTPEKAAEVTLQPIRRFGMDAAILFSDILVVPHALGVDVRFEEKKGPVLQPVQTLQALDRLTFNRDRLASVYEALRLTGAGLPEETALIGFVGAPWTLACYMVQGGSDREFQQVRAVAMRNFPFFSRLIAVLTEAVTAHALAQIEAGAEVIQIFDSWAGVLSAQEFSRWVMEPTRSIVSAIHAAHPHVPVIGFPRQAGAQYADYAKITGVDAVSVDYSAPLPWVNEQLQGICAVQGNLDPLLLAEDKDAMLAQAGRIVRALANRPFIFNLGHGILPHTPVEHVQALCRFLTSPAVMDA